MSSRKKTYKKYTDKQKIAYYKKKAAEAKAGQPKAIRPRYSGHGRYKKSAPQQYSGAGAYVGGALGGAIGTAFAPGIGSALGVPIGAAAGYLADKVFGWGDYTIHKNTLLFAEQPPLFEGSEYVRIRHREYIGDISSTTSFTNRSYSINPSNADAFPWLSVISDQFEQYRFNGLIFEFISTSADALNSTNTALGTVILATDYDAEDSAFVNQQQMLSTMFSNGGKPSCNILHAIECDPQSLPTKWLYCRSSSVSNGPDARLYDLGNFQVATYGSQAAAVIGQLWVTYDVTFQKKQMNNVLGLALKTVKYNFTGTINTTTYFGSSTEEPESGSNFDVTLANGVITFPPMISGGLYSVMYHVRGTSAAVTAPTITLANCTSPQIWVNGASSNVSNTGSTSANFVLYFFVKITAQGATVTFSGGGLPSSITDGELVINQVNGNIES